jgi:predicted Zn-dependent protease
MSAAVRAGALALALVACAWFALTLRQADEVAAASQILAGPQPLTAARADRAAALLRAAATLNPDRGVAILEGELALEAGHPAQAQRILARVVTAEPQNLQAWIWLARSSYGAPATFRRAVQAVGRLLRNVPPAR